MTDEMSFENRLKGKKENLDTPRWNQKHLATVLNVSNDIKLDPSGSNRLKTDRIEKAYFGQLLY